MAEKSESEVQASEARESAPFVSFVLLDAAQWDKAQFIANLKRDWEIEVGTDESGDADALVFQWNGMFAAASLMKAPVPNGEAERNAANNYLWQDAVAVTKTHVAHVLVAVLPKDQDLREAGQLLVKLCAALLENEHAIGVYTSGTVFQPEFYRDAAEVMKDGELPYYNWIYFGLLPDDNGDDKLSSGYTYGMSLFGKDEIEVLNTAADPEELYAFLFNMAAYVIEADAVLQDGQTIGFSAEEKLPITRSPGRNLDGITLKIGFKPAFPQA